MHDVQRISELVVPRFAARSRATFGSLDCEMFKRACGWIRFNCCFAMHVRRARNTNMLIPSFFYVELTLSQAIYCSYIQSTRAMHRSFRKDRPHFSRIRDIFRSKRRRYQRTFRERERDRESGKIDGTDRCRHVSAAFKSSQEKKE